MPEWTEERMRAFARLAASKKQKSRSLTQEERSTARVQTQDWLGDDPQKGLFPWKRSIQATQDSVHAGLKLPLYQRMVQEEKQKSRDPELEALERKSKKATYLAQYQKFLIQQEKTKIEKRLTELDQKIIDGSITPDERRERNRLKYKSEEGDFKSPYETVMKGIEQKREIEDILWEWNPEIEDWAKDENGNRIPNPELSPDQKAVLYDRYVRIGKDAGLAGQVNRLKSAGLVTSVEELK